MSDKPISPLRRRMIEDMTVRNFVEKTRNDYIRIGETRRQDEDVAILGAASQPILIFSC